MAYLGHMLFPVGRASERVWRKRCWANKNVNRHRCPREHGGKVLEVGEQQEVVESGEKKPNSSMNRSE